MVSKDRVGTALHVSKSSGNLILKAEREAKIGDAVVDSKGKRVGRIFDVFGPVSAPFISVKPKDTNPEKLVGKALFKGKKRR